MTNDVLASLLGAWSSGLGAGAILFRVLLSLALSAVIGCERSSKRHSAGLRTFIVVSLAATTAAIMEVWLLSAGHDALWLGAAVTIGAAIISGYSILFSSRGLIKGLTTSAGLWASAMIGLAVGTGLYTLALFAFAAVLCTLALFPAIERYLKDRSNHFEVHLELKNKSDLSSFASTIRRLGMKIDDIEMNPAYINSGLSVYTVSFTISSAELKKYKSHGEIIAALATLDYVSYIEEMV